jgi:hypothetical protein
MNKKNRLFGLRGKKKQAGYTLLEYCAGAAVLLGLVIGAINLMGGSLQTLAQGISDWAQSASQNVQNLGTGSGTPKP